MNFNYFGAGTTKYNAYKSKIIQIKNIKLGFLGYDSIAPFSLN